MPLGCIRAVVFVSAALALSEPATTQPRGGSPQQPSGSQPRGGSVGNVPGVPPPGTPGNNVPQGTIPGSEQPNPQSLPQEQAPRLIFLSGRVMVDDGTVPPDSALIESVCSGVEHGEGYTDSKGRFSFQLGDPHNGVIQDASIENPESNFGQPTAGGSNPSWSRSGLGQRFLADCELQAVLPGYRSESINLFNRRELDNPDVGTIMLHRIAQVEGRVVSVSTLAAPKGARKTFEKGQEALKKHKPEEARKDFEKATQLYPEFAAAWYELGKIQVEQRQFDDAGRSFEAAIKADPKYVDPYLTLSFILAQRHDWRKLSETAGEAIKLDPYDYPQAYFMNAVANYNLHDVDAAEKSAREAEKIDSRRIYPKSWQLLGIILTNRQHFDEAAEQFREYLKAAPKASDADATRAELARVENLAASTADRTK